jgi:hypothetical protein
MIFKTTVHLVGFLFIDVIADARNHEPEFRIHGRFYSYLSQSFSRDPALCGKKADKFSPEEQEKD